MSRLRGGPPPIDSVKHHRDWLALVEVSGPFLSLPVLRQTWPTLDTLDKEDRADLRRAHGMWRTEPASGADKWIDWVLGTFLGWGDELRVFGQETGEQLAVEVAEHDVTLQPSFVLVEPGTEAGGELRAESVRLLGMTCQPGLSPTARVPDSTWAATPADRLAHLCRHHGVELGLVTDGRRWTLVRAPRNKVTTTATFDAIGWAEAADRDVVRAFRSFLGRTRFFGVLTEQRLPALLDASEDAQEDITEALGGQVRQAVELLVAALGRADVREQQAGRPGLRQLDAHDVYRGAVTVMMRIVFVLFAEERRLLPSDNDLYARSYSAGRLGAELQERANEGSEVELSHSTAAWHRLIALFRAVYSGIDHPRLRMHPHGGSMFEPDEYSWLDPEDFAAIDDQTVLHMLRAVQTVQVGTGRNKETRTLSFRQLDVEQIGYVYEGLLSYDGFRANDVMVGLVGKVGLEVELRLAELEALPRDELAATLADKYKKSGIGSVRALTKALTEPDATTLEQRRKKLLAVTDGDYPLAERLLPFAGIIREDLRELPLVILPGALFVTESPLRRNTGTHYTPRALAEEVVEHALEPLIYHNGPLQTADRSHWVPKNPREILELKVADIAMGSAAFLVAAARYLGAALLEARVREGEIEAPVLDETRPVDADEDPQVVDARRDVIEHCLYGVDINPMAVEMAKLSLWLVSMDDRRPFTFLDDRLVEGDSLLGITSIEQLEYMHVDPSRAREIHDGAFDWGADIRALISNLTRKRQQIAEVDVVADPLGGLQRKEAILAEAQQLRGVFGILADLVAGAALATSGNAGYGRKDGHFLEAMSLASNVVDGMGLATALTKIRQWLTKDSIAGRAAHFPIHWPLDFPEVLQEGGFDAIVGNPPFLGGKKISGALSSRYREYLVGVVGRGVKGNADLVAYFTRRAVDLLSSTGQLGLIATNTLAQGDTREVGLDRLCSSGLSIRGAVKSRPWPARSAALEYCVVWASQTKPGSDARYWVDAREVQGVTSSLDPAARVIGLPFRLAENAGVAFQGSNLLGVGFTMSQADAEAMIANDEKNRVVVKPFMTGEELNSSVSGFGSRWVVNFGERSELESRTWPLPWAWVERNVKPGRMEKDGSKYPRMVDQWWKHWNSRESLYRKIGDLDHVLSITLHTSTVLPVYVRSRQVFSHGITVFATEDPAVLTQLSSALHYWWAVKNGSSIKADLRYVATDVFETFPRATSDSSLRDLGQILISRRTSAMEARSAGLTQLYKVVFNSSIDDSDIVELRRIHRDIDIATLRAYGWDDLVEKLDHGFHPAGRDVRYTIGPWAQREILDRLLELNHERYAEEVKQGLHDKKKGRKAAPPKPEGGGLW